LEGDKMNGFKKNKNGTTKRTARLEESNNQLLNNIIKENKTENNYIQKNKKESK